MKFAICKYSQYLIVVIACALILSVGSCSSRHKSPVIARVGKSVLTLDDLYKSIPPEYSRSITRDQNIHYIKQWMDTELLYQEALRRKIDHDPVILKRIEKMKKDLLSAEVLSRKQIAQQDSTLVSDAMVHEYFVKHQKEFVRTKDIVRYMEIVVDNAEKAQQIKQKATEDNFAQLASSITNMPVIQPEKMPYITLDDVLPQVRELMVSSKVPGILGPIKSEAGYHIIYVLDKLNEGGVCNENEVKNDIVNTLSTTAQKEDVEQLLSELRLKTDVEFHFDQIPDLNKNGADVGASTQH